MRLVIPTPATIRIVTSTGRPSRCRLWICNPVETPIFARLGKVRSKIAEGDEGAAAPEQGAARGEQPDSAHRARRQSAPRRPQAERGAGARLHAQGSEPEHRPRQPARRRRGRHRRRQHRVDDRRERVEPPAGDKPMHRRHPRLQVADLGVLGARCRCRNPRCMMNRPASHHDDTDDHVDDVLDALEGEPCAEARDRRARRPRPAAR